MEKISFESLRQEDLALRQREDIVRLQESAFEQIAKEEKEKVIKDVRDFIARCHKAGKYISDEQVRDSLRAILRYWGTFVYNASGVYPRVDLADLEIPAPKMRIKSSPVSLLVAGMLLLGAIAWLFASGYPSVRQTPTPVATVQTPVISEPKLSASAPLNPGQEVAISVDVSSATEVALNYTWKTEGGEIVGGQGSPAIIYRAPDEPGTYNVRVVVEWNGQSVEKPTSIKVEKPTPTPTPVLPTDMPTPTATPLPGVSPTLRLTPPPPSEGLVITNPTQDAEVTPITTARGQWVEVAERGDLHLEVLVRSLEPYEPYWVQSRPSIRDDGTWQSSPVHIGRVGMDEGIGFEICVVATTLDLSLGEQLYELPEGPNFCVLVTRE